MDGLSERENDREISAFKQLQAKLEGLFARIMPDPLLPRSILVVPSLTLDEDVLSRITGVPHYEERMLPLLMLLRLPRARLVYVTSEPLSEAIVDYYLHLLPGIPHRHARERLILLNAHDGSPQPLSEKILARPRLLHRIGEALGDPADAHMICFNVAPPERALAVRLGVPIYGCDPDLLHLGSKSGSRQVFREAGIDLPDGFEDLHTPAELADALTRLKRRHPHIAKAVVKLNEGFSGEGNALFHFGGAPAGEELIAWIEARLPDLAFEARNMDWATFSQKLAEMGGIVELFIEGAEKRSPSVQCRIEPNGQIDVISSHDQVLGGKSGQTYIGCTFPADAEYRLAIQGEGFKAAEVLARHGVIGRFGVDFISVRTPAGWRHHAIEINLRKGGTTHPFQMLQFLTGGTFDPESGTFSTVDGRQRSYFATDNLESERYRGLSPSDLIDIAVRHGIHFHGATQSGVAFHLIGALSEFGKLGMVCIAEDVDAAHALYRQTVEILDAECDP
ncbi:MAG TPA: peptide ligase PGM1-related protein [Devosiaceae bacterium]